MADTTKCILCFDEHKEMTLIDNEHHFICQQILHFLQLKLCFEEKALTQICKNCVDSLKKIDEFYEKIHAAQAFAQAETKLKTQKTNRQECYEITEVDDDALDDDEEDTSNETDDNACKDSETAELISDGTVAVPIKTWKSYTWYCFMCVYSSMNFSTLTTHAKSKHNICTLKKMQYQCIDCKKIYPDYAVFLNHVRLHHKELELCCDVCSQQCKDFEQLSKHRKEHNEQDEVVQPYVYNCNRCRMVYPSSTTFNKHLLSHKGGLECTVCNKSFKKLKYLKRHSEMHEKLQYKCQYCDKTFYRKFNQVSHERTHTGERPFQCSHCDQSFSFQSTLKSHVRTHTGEMPYKCTHCKEKFRHYDSLKEHTRIHTKETPYKCQLCGDNFRFRKSLHRHMRIHADENPIKCNKCSKTFKTKADLKNHICKSQRKSSRKARKQILQELEQSEESE